MTKPLGISLDIIGGLPRMSVSQSDRAADAVWDAVEVAISAGMTPQQFRREAADAWEHVIKEEAKHARQELLR